VINPASMSILWIYTAKIYKSSYTLNLKWRILQQQERKL